MSNIERIANSMLHQLGCFKPPSETSRVAVVSLQNCVGQYLDVPVNEGAIGCLDREDTLILGCSNHILKSLNDSSRQELKKEIENEIAFFFPRKTVVFSDNYPHEFQDFKNHSCVEKYIHAIQFNNKPIYGMTVAWFSSDENIHCPNEYLAARDDDLEFMVPCKCCKSNSILMMNHALGITGHVNA